MKNVLQLMHYNNYFFLSLSAKIDANFELKSTTYLPHCGLGTVE